MKVYLAGEQFAGVEDKVKRRLFSYWYNRNNTKHIDLAYKFGQDLFLDSGAFTAFTQKTEIDPKLYAEFIHDNGDKFTTCSSLDAIGDPEKSYQLLKELEDLGVKVQPVFHAREDDKWLIKYLEEGYDYIFIGGMVPETTNWLKGWLDYLFTNYLTDSKGRAVVKLHGFGLTDQQLMFRYPWHSVDSTSWLFTGSFGSCVFMINKKLHKIVFTPESPSAKKLDAPHYFNLPQIMKKEIDKWLEKFEVTAEQCSEHYSYRNVVNSRTFQEMEDLGTDTFIKRDKGLFDA